MNKKDNQKGVSPVVGFISMVIVAVTLVLIPVMMVFSDIPMLVAEEFNPEVFVLRPSSVLGTMIMILLYDLISGSDCNCDCEE